MKALVAMTCVAVLAAVGYFFWGEYNVYAARRDAEAAAMERLSALTKQMEAAAREAMRRPCIDAANELRAYNTFSQPKNVQPESPLRDKINACLAQGTISMNEVADVANRL